MRAATMSTALLIGLGIGATGCTAPPPAPVSASSAPLASSGEVDCLNAVAARLAEWKQSGVDGPELERRYQEALAACAGPGVDACTASFVGSVNFQYTVLSERLAHALLTPSDYVKAVRSLGRKLRLSRRDSTWCTSFQAGDSDDDLVPDDRDHCLKSPPFTPTDDSGCPLSSKERDEVAGPDARAFAQVLRRMPIMISDACNGAPPPDVPKLIAVHREAGPPQVLLRTTKVHNQPAGCLVHYEMVAHAWSKEPYTQSQAQDDRMQTTFKSIEDESTSESSTRFRIVSTWEHPCVTSPTCSQLLQYGFSKQPPSRRALARGACRHDTIEVRLRAVNGNGVSSAWSTNTVAIDGLFPWMP
jgi:hypothetical protein